MSSNAISTATGRTPETPRVREASKQLLRHIADENLQPGDRLMSQGELRAALGFSNNTLTPAMASLTRMGVLRRQRGMGTVVVDPAAVDKELWNLALPVFSTEVILNSPFFAQLSQCLHSRSRELGYGCTLYSSLRDASTQSNKAEHLPGLTDACAEGSVDAVISPVLLHDSVVKQLEELSIPVCHVGPWDPISNGVAIDQRQMAIEATRVLVGKHCRRIALVCQPMPDRKRPRYFQGYAQAMKAAGLEVRTAFLDGLGTEAGRRVATELLGMPADERPDGLILLDDWTAMGVAAQLRSATEYRPELAVQVNRQAPLTFALPIFRFEVDIAALAFAAVGMAAERLLNRSLPNEIRFCPPVFAGLQQPD